MVDLEAERLITEARSALKDLESHFRKLTVVHEGAAFNEPLQGSPAASLVGQIDWGTLTSRVGWKSGPAGFSATVRRYRDQLPCASSSVP